MEMQELVERLGCSGACRGLTEEEAARVAALGSIREVAAGECLVREGEPGDDMQVLLHGSADVFKRDPERGEEVHLSAIAAGESVGEMAILRHDRRLATVKAKEACSVFVLPRAAFEQLLDAGEPAAYKVGLKMARTLADRLAWINDRLVEVMRLAGNRPDSPELERFKRKILEDWNF